MVDTVDTVNFLLKIKVIEHRNTKNTNTYTPYAKRVLCTYTRARESSVTPYMGW